jgi:hypothetical protein
MKKYLIATLICLSSFAYADSLVGEKTASNSVDACLAAVDPGCGPCKKRCLDNGSDRNYPRKDSDVVKTKTATKASSRRQ